MKKYFWILLACLVLAILACGIPARSLPVQPTQTSEDTEEENNFRYITTGSESVKQISTGTIYVISVSAETESDGTGYWQITIISSALSKPIEGKNSASCAAASVSCLGGISCAVTITDAEKYEFSD